MVNVNFVTTQLKGYGVKLLILGILILNSEIVLANIIINEIMYNPSGSDDGHEWIEIYSNESINISGWKFYEAGTNHGLTLINGSWVINGYAIIADEWDTFLSDYPNFNGTLFDSSFSLKNSGEYLALKNGSNIVDEVNYSTDMANGNGKSLERFDYGWNESSVMGGSPGKQNNDSIIEQAQNKGLKLTIYIKDPAYVGITYTSLFKIENLDHITGITDHINLTIGYNITSNNSLIKQDTISIEDLNLRKTSNTGLFVPIVSGNYTITGWIINSTVNDSNSIDDIDFKTISVIDTSKIPCNITINITTNQTIFTEGNKIYFYNNLNDETFPFKIEYWIEDFFGNIYKNKLNTTYTTRRSWKTKIIEQDRVLFIKSIVYPLCNDSNTTDNSAEKMFIVKSSSSDSTESDKESSLEITEVDEKVKFGEVVDVKVKIYKGNTNRYSIKLYVEGNGKKVSETTKIHMYDKYSSYNGQLSIQLNPNCNLKLENGKYDVVLEGLGEEDEKGIKIEGIKTSLCGKSSTKTSSASSSSKKFDYRLIDYPKKISSSQEFDIKVEIQNNDDKDSEVDIWSYVYRGPKSYSGDRQQNKKHITIDADSSEIITLTNKVSGLEDGDYKLKVVINKDNQKTNKEIIEEISVSGSSSYSTKCPSVEYSPNFGNPIILAEYNIFNQLLCTDNIHYKQIIYESKNEKIKKLIPYFIITLTTLLSIILIFTKQSKPF